MRKSEDEFQNRILQKKDVGLRKSFKILCKKVNTGIIKEE